jgi:hypothetical protein
MATGKIGGKDTVLLNITGGGTKKLESTGKKIPLKPDIIFTREDLSAEAVSAKLKRFQKAKGNQEVH